MFRFGLSFSINNQKSAINNRFSALAPAYPSANSQTQLCRKYNFDRPDRSPGCRSTSIDDLPIQDRNAAEPPSPDTTASRHTLAERNPLPELHHSHTLG